MSLLKRPTPEKAECVADDCKIRIPRRLLMCPKHWRKVPRPIQQRIYMFYRPGQEIDKNYSDDYIIAVMDAIQAVRDWKPRHLKEHTPQ